MTPDVVQVKPQPDYFLEAVFANGEHRRFDMKPYLAYPAFSQLTDANFFMAAHVANGTVVWNDEIDLSPDTLYLRGESIEQQ
ncbi:MAG: DUF2442 domain-containing protein [Gallionella sp.]|nr:DUF2442 domain-containing protein [Gallionella sp.]